jgi:two-component system aerobic respiration control sensor histidine kinase ArcB
MLPKKLDPTKIDCSNFDNFFSQSNSPAILLSSTGQILSCNNAFLALYSVSFNQILNKDYFSICQEHSIAPPFPTINEILDNSSKTATSVTRHNLSSPKTLQWSASIMNHEGLVQNICLYGIDISAFINESIMTKKIQDHIIDHLPSHYIFWKNIEGYYLGCNEAFAHSLNYKSSKEVIGKTDYDFPVKKEDSDAYRKDDKEVMASKKPKLNIEEPQTLSNGETRILLTSKVPLIDEENNVYGVLAIYSDITEMKKMSLSLQKALTAAESASIAKTEFIRNMSHDIRTPLTGIIGMADMIAQEITSEGVQDIRQAGVALLNLVNEIIETVQLESGNIKDEKECFALKSTVNALTEIFKPAIKQKGLTIKTYYDENIPEILFGQPLLLHRIILNLLGNAVKFTDKGSVSLEVTLSQKESNKVSLKIVVSDTGIGIPANKQETIFDKFSRLSPSYSNNYKGTGLGLYMVKEFINKLGGDIKVNSAIDRGTQFICVVPFEIPTTEQLKHYHQHQYEQRAINSSVQRNHNNLPKMLDASNLPPHNDNMKIDTNVSTEKLRTLLVEDTPLPRKIAESLLIKEGYEVITAETVQEAIEKSNQMAFDLIYMDIGLPDGTGIDVTRAIRSNPANPNVNTYIVALTAHADPEIKMECLNAGMQEVFNKPLDPIKIEIAEINMNNRLFGKGDDKKQNEENCKNDDLLILDLASATQLMGGNEAIAKEMIASFMDELPSFRQNITDAFNNEDWNTLKHFVHKLHGGLCYSGMPRLKYVTSEFEKQLNQKAGNYNRNYSTLMEEMNHVVEKYNQLKD